MPCPVYRWTEDRREEVASALRASRTRRDAAELLKTTPYALDAACQRYGLKPLELLGRGAAPEADIVPPPETDLPVEEIIALREKRFALTEANAAARREIPVHIRDRDLLPIGLLSFGDPHIDSPGSDLKLLFRHSDIVRETDGVFAASVGDTRDNWIGRLARLYEDQGITGNESWRLAEHWLNERLGKKKVLYLVGGNHDCHDAETEALTRRGWLRHDEIQDDDRVLSLVPETGKCEWAPILGRITRQHDGEIVGLRTRSISLAVTPQHRVLCRDRDWLRRWRSWRYVHADALPPRVALPVSGFADRPGADLSDDQIALAGWILTDGCISGEARRPNLTPRVSIHQSKSGAEIDRILGALRLEHTKRVRTRSMTEVCGRTLVKPARPETTWRLSATAARSVLAWLPQKKTLPDWSHQLDARQFAILLDALVAGDGCWDGVSPESKSVAVLHGSREFLDSVQAVAVQHGWYARISVARGKDYRLNLCRRDVVQIETKPATSRWVYSGTVWCLTVPRGNFMIRRDGAAHFSGNCWSGNGDPHRWIARQMQALYQSSEVRIALKFKGAPDVLVNCRHDFEGHSMWNTGHGPLKALTLGVRDHIAICGHRHTSGYNIFKDPESGVLCHAIRVASYKRFDRYQIEKGFRDQNIAPCAFTTIDPRLPPTHPDLVKLWHDPEEGAAILTWARERKRAT